jgi:hypothetical protein
MFGVVARTVKFFTRERWASDDYADWERARTAYNKYLESIRSRLPPALSLLAFGVSLHDANLNSLHVDTAAQELTFILDGYEFVNGIPEIPRRYELRYHGVTDFRADKDSDGARELLDRQDLGYVELELLESSLFEHRMLFSSGTELSIRFRHFDLHHEHLPKIRDA